MNSNLKAFLLVILTLSVLIIAIVELTGISTNSARYKSLFRNGGEGEFVSKDGIQYHGEIYPQENITRTERASHMQKTTMQFYETKFNFGSIPEGTVVKHVFRFKNTGVNPLYIVKADVTCGCTVPTFPLETIAPDAEGELVVEYNSTGKNGMQHKNVVIHSNALPEAVTITIEADVR